jgi:excisionase family DNA binding protein
MDSRQELMTVEGTSAGLLTVPETATFLRLKVSTIRAWVLKRRIPFVKLGGRVFVRKADVQELIEVSVVPAKAQ